MLITEHYTLPSLYAGILRRREPKFGFGLLGAAVYYRCVAVGTKILTADLRWVNAEDLAIGDELVGIDEEGGGTSGSGRKLRLSVVEDTGVREDDCYEVVTDQGTIVVSTQHPFLATNGRGDYWRWVKVEDLTPDYTIRFVSKPWEHEDGDSWLAGFFDGEGTLSPYRVAASQNIGKGLAERAFAEIKGRGFDPAWYEELLQHKTPHVSVAVNGTRNVMRFVGQVRPQRLLVNWRRNLATSPHTLRNGPHARVLSVTPVGKREIVSLQTSTRTFIAEGLVCHNTYSRIKADGSQESWADTVIRVVEGVISIRKWWYVIHRLPWNQERWDDIAMRMADAIFHMRFLPPGRGLVHSPR